MDVFDCDYKCRTVGEGIYKYDIPNDWSAEFDAYDNVYPTIVIQVSQIRENSALMNVKLKIVENPDDEYAGCIVFRKKKTIVFKIDYMGDIVMAMKNTAVL